MNDLQALALTLVYGLAVLTAAEFLYRRSSLNPVSIRKAVHVALGTWALPTLFLFHSWTWAVAAPALFVVCNLICLRYRVWPGFHLETHVSAGSVLYPLSFVWLVGAFWDSPWRMLAAVGLMVMTYGDAMAWLIGRRWGGHRLLVFGSVKSLEGTLAMFLTSSCVAFALLYGFGFLPLQPTIAISLLVGAVAALTELAGPGGLDNITVPVVVAYLCLRLVS